MRGVFCECGRPAKFPVFKGRRVYWRVDREHCLCFKCRKAGASRAEAERLKEREIWNQQ